MNSTVYVILDRGPCRPIRYREMSAMFAVAKANRLAAMHGDYVVVEHHQDHILVNASEFYKKLAQEGGTLVDKASPRHIQAGADTPRPTTYGCTQ